MIIKCFGFSQDAAEATAEALGAAIGGALATKADIAAVKADIAGLRNELKADIAALRAYIDAEIAPLKADMRLLRWQIAVAGDPGQAVRPLTARPATPEPFDARLSPCR